MTTVLTELKAIISRYNSAPTLVYRNTILKDLAPIHDLAVAEQARLVAAEKIFRRFIDSLPCGDCQDDGTVGEIRIWLASCPKPQPGVGEARCAMGWCGKPAIDGLYCPVHTKTQSDAGEATARCEHDMPKKICIACGTPTASPDVLRERACVELRDYVLCCVGNSLTKTGELELAGDAVDAIVALAAARLGRKE